MRKINIVVNIFNFFVGLISLISAIIVWKILPQGQGFQGGRTELDINLFLGITRHNWMDIHIVFSLIFIGLIFIHLILHWQWIKSLPKIMR